ncbi:hypothetical protein L1049_019378 [Liquidambar formosana]|uniref:Uncharacterized protein n=1 Tax=Liquidambar formosana TaxID=63359 RepID=A0AAP0X586_LIQFO
MAASSSDHPDRTKPNTGLNPPRKVRVVAKIRAFTDVEFGPFKGVCRTPWISVHKPKGELSESVAISFGDQSTSRRETYEVDYCYEQHEDNCLIFSREIKPLISDVFDGHERIRYCIWC